MILADAGFIRYFLHLAAQSCRFKIAFITGYTILLDSPPNQQLETPKSGWIMLALGTWCVANATTRKRSGPPIAKIQKQINS